MDMENYIKKIIFIKDNLFKEYKMELEIKYLTIKFKKWCKLINLIHKYLNNIVTLACLKMVRLMVLEK